MTIVNTQVLNEDKLIRVAAASGSTVAKSDSDDLVDAAQGGLYVIATGNVKFNDADGNVITLTAVPAFVRIPIVARRVWSTGTTATVLALN